MSGYQYDIDIQTLLVLSLLDIDNIKEVLNKQTNDGKNLRKLLLYIIRQKKCRAALHNGE